VALYKPVKPELDSIALLARVVSDSTHAQIKRLLNPDQQAKLDRMRAAARRELAERRGGDTVGGPPGPPGMARTRQQTKTTKRRCSKLHRRFFYRCVELYVIGIRVSLHLPKFWFL